MNMLEDRFAENLRIKEARILKKRLIKEKRIQNQKRLLQKDRLQKRALRIKLVEQEKSLKIKEKTKQLKKLIKILKFVEKTKCLKKELSPLEYDKQFKLLKYKKNYYKQNRDRLIQKAKEKQAQKKLKKINKKISDKMLNTLRCRISKALKRNQKAFRTQNLLGCSLDELRAYLESLFKPGMNWNNYGTGANGKGMKEWHLDHIKPCASFDLSKPEEQQKCFHYSNLQPLWAKENLEKKDIYFPPN